MDALETLVTHLFVNPLCRKYRSFAQTKSLCVWSHLDPRCCRQMGCQWMIWIHPPQSELSARHRSRHAEGFPEAANENECAAGPHFPSAELSHAEGEACDSWQDALWKRWRTGLPAAAANKIKFLLYFHYPGGISFEEDKTPLWLLAESELMVLKW